MPRRGIIDVEIDRARDAQQETMKQPHEQFHVLDGFEFLDTFNSRVDWRHVPVVVITAKQLTNAERGMLSVRTIIEKGDSIDRDIAAAVGKAVGRRPTRVGAET